MLLHCKKHNKITELLFHLKLLRSSIQFFIHSSNISEDSTYSYGVLHILHPLQSRLVEVFLNDLLRLVVLYQYIFKVTKCNVMFLEPCSPSTIQKSSQLSLLCLQWATWNQFCYSQPTSLTFAIRLNVVLFCTGRLCLPNGFVLSGLSIQIMCLSHLSYPT